MTVAAKKLKQALDEADARRGAVEVARLRQSLDRERTHVRDLEAELADAHERITLLERLGDSVPTIPKWLVGNGKKGALHHGTISLALSDCHFDEIVRPEEVEGTNAYNRKIAVKRLHKVLDGTVSLARGYYAGLKYDGIVVKLLGDFLSGAIHEELEQTNEDTVYGGLDFWSEHIAAVLLELQRQFGKVHCVGVVGNHGRRTRKPRMKLRVRDNLDWLLYRMVARATTGRGITWDVPESADADVQIYSTRYKVTHGDQFRGGSGIAGIMSPLMLGQHRKARRQTALGRGFDWMCLGHFHEYIHGRGLIVNGSLKGYDEFAYMLNFVPERPQQAFWITTPEHGASFASPVFADDRKSEGW